MIGSRAFKIFAGFSAISLGSINLLTAFNTFKSYTTSIMEAPGKISQIITQFKNRKKASSIYSAVSEILPKVKTVKPLLDAVRLRTLFEGIDPSDPTISMTMLTLDIISQCTDPMSIYEKPPVDALVKNKMASGGFELGIADNLAGLQGKIVEVTESALEIRHGKLIRQLDEVKQISQVREDLSERSIEVAVLARDGRTPIWIDNEFIAPEPGHLYKFKLVGAPADESYTVVFIPSGCSLEQAKKIIHRRYGLNSLLEVQLTHDGKLLQEGRNLEDILTHKRDKINVQEGTTIEEISAALSSVNLISAMSFQKGGAGLEVFKKIHEEINEFVKAHSGIVSSQNNLYNILFGDLYKLSAHGQYEKRILEVHNFIQKFTKLEKIVISKLQSHDVVGSQIKMPLRDVFREHLGESFYNSYMEYAPKGDSEYVQKARGEYRDIVLAMLKKYLDTIYISKQTSKILLEKSVGNCLLRELLGKAEYSADDAEANIHKVFERINNALLNDFNKYILAEDNLKSFRELWLKDSYASFLSSTNIKLGVFLRYHNSLIDYISDYGELETHEKFIPRIFSKLISKFKGSKVDILLKEDKNNNLYKAYENALSELGVELRIADNGKIVIVSKDGKQKEIIMAPQKTSDNVRLLGDLIVDFMSLLKLNSLENIGDKHNPEVISNVFLISLFSDNFGTREEDKINYIMKFLEALMKIKENKHLQPPSGLSKKLKGSRQELLENSLIEQMNKEVEIWYENPTKSQYMGYFNTFLENLKDEAKHEFYDDKTNLDLWINSKFSELFKKMDYTRNEIIGVLTEIQKKLDSMVTVITNVDNPSVEKWGILRTYQIGYQFITDQKLSAANVPNCDVFYGLDVKDVPVPSDIKLGILQTYSTTYIHNKKTGENALIVADNPDFKLPNGYALGYYDGSVSNNKRIIYGQYFTKRGGNLLINQIKLENGEFKVKSDNYWRSEMMNHLLTTEYFDGDSKHEDPIGVRLFIAQQYIDGDRQYSYCETVNLIDPALAEGDWNFKPPIRRPFFSRAAQGTESYYRITKESSKDALLTKKEKPDPKSLKLIPILNYLVEQVKEFSDKTVAKFLPEISASSSLYNLFAFGDIKSFSESLDALHISGDDLKDINRYEIVKGKLDFNEINVKKFYNTFLKQIKATRYGEGDPVFDKLFEMDPISDEDNKIFESKEEAEKVDRINDALERIFGFTGLFLLKAGLLTFETSESIYGTEYICHNVVPNWDQLQDIFRVASIKLREGGSRVGWGNVKQLFIFKDTLESNLLSFLLNGYREVITYKENGINKEIASVRLPNFAFLNGLYDGVDRVVPYTIAAKFKADFYEPYSINRQEVEMERFFESGNEAMKVVLKLIDGQKEKYSSDIIERLQVEAARELSRVNMKIMHSGINVDTLRKQVEDFLSDKSKEKVIKLYLRDRIDPYEIPLSGLSGAETFDKFGIVIFGTPSTLFAKKDFDLFIFNKVGDLLQDYNDDLKNGEKGSFKEWLIKNCYGLVLYYIS